VTELARIAAALEELVSIERERRAEERETRAAKRAPRQRREQRQPSPESHQKAAAVLRKLGVR